MFRYLFTFLLLIAGTTDAAITWQTDYKQALQQSKITSKPVVLFFTGSDWCGWCHKLEQEAFDTTEFESSAGEQFIFVKLDYPMKSQQEPTLKAQNQMLKDQFQIKSFPTIILIGSNGESIGLTGYRPGGGKLYASHLSKMVNDYTAYQKKIYKK